MSTSNPDLAVPTIHLNGTSAGDLREAWERSYGALGQAKRILQETAPNKRDFYVQKDGDTNFEKARAQHFERLQKLESIRQELVALVEGVDAQLEERRKLRGESNA